MVPRSRAQAEQMWEHAGKFPWVPERQTPDIMEKASLPQNVPERDHLAHIYPYAPPGLPTPLLSLAGPDGKR